MWFNKKEKEMKKYTATIKKYRFVHKYEISIKNKKKTIEVKVSADQEYIDRTFFDWGLVYLVDRTALQTKHVESAKFLKKIKKPWTETLEIDEDDVFDYLDDGYTVKGLK